MGVMKDHSVLVACIGGGAAIVAAFAKPISEALFGDAPQPAPPAVVAADPYPETPITPTPQTIEGAWKQYILTADEGDVYLGTFVVSRNRGEYVISPRAQTEGERMQNSLGVFDVAYSGDAWTFNSNWGGGEVGNFELRRKSPTMFEGEIRVAGQLENRTRFVKIE